MYEKYTGNLPSVLLDDSQTVRQRGRSDMTAVREYPLILQMRASLKDLPA
jgi:hypothetical protein